MGDLTLPGDIPGLLRRGSPVFWRDEETPHVVLHADAVSVFAAPVSMPSIGVQDHPDAFALDLTDATGRFHAALWLLADLNAAGRPDERAPKAGA